MPKRKTKKAVAKRFKVTKNGKVKIDGIEFEVSENQIKDMKRLEESYSQQLNSLSTLVSGTSTLTKTQNEKIQEITEKEKEK